MKFLEKKNLNPFEFSLIITIYSLLTALTAVDSWWAFSLVFSGTIAFSSTMYRALSSVAWSANQNPWVINKDIGIINSLNICCRLFIRMNPLPWTNHSDIIPFTRHLLNQWINWVKWSDNLQSRLNLTWLLLHWTSSKKKPSTIKIPQWIISFIIISFFFINQLTLSQDS